MSGEGTGSEGRTPCFQAKSQSLPETHQFPSSPLFRPGRRDSPSTFRRGRGLPKITSTQARGFPLPENPSSSVGSKASKKPRSLGGGGTARTRRNARNETGGTLQGHQSTGSRAVRAPARSEEARPSDLAAATASSAPRPPLPGRSDRRRRGAPGACSVHCLSFPPVCGCDVEAQTSKQFAAGRRRSASACCFALVACFSLSPLPVLRCWLLRLPSLFLGF
jgi:hypothetical protein